MNTQSTAPAERFMAALHALDRDGPAAMAPMLALFAPEATIDNPALTLADEQRRGAAGVGAFWSGYARDLQGATTDFHATTTSGDAIGLFWTTRRPAQGNSRPLSYDGATLLRLDAAGAIVAMRGYYDTRALEPVKP